MGFFEDIFGGSSSGVESPYGSGDQAFIDKLKNQIGQIGSTFDLNSLMAAFRPNAQYQQAGDILSGFNPSSYFSGALGTLGQASDFANGDYFNNLLGSSFTDVTNSPEVKGALDAISNQATRSFNQGADQVNASAQRASGGTGAGTAGANQLSRLSSDIASNVADQSKQTILGELARRQQLQQAGALGKANILSQIAGLQSNIGQNIGNFGLQQAQGLQGLGGILQALQQGGASLPLDLQFQLANLLRGTTTTNSTPGILSGVTGLIGALNNGGGKPPIPVT